MIWGDIKALITAMVPAAVGSGFVETNSGNPPEINLYARMVNNIVCGFPHKFSWTVRTGTLTLIPGQTTYNLKTYFPDLVRVYQVLTNQNGNREVPYQSPRDFNITIDGGSRCTIQGFTLKTDGSLSGNLTIPYYSNYLVIDGTTGDRKMDFETDDDLSVLPDEHYPVIVEGILYYVYRKDRGENGKLFTTRRRTYDGRITDSDPFFFLLDEMALNDVPIEYALYDFRFTPIF